MQRLSVSIDDDLAEWVASQADERGVSKAKIIRDAVESARVTGFVQLDDAEKAEGADLIDRIEELDARVTALERGVADSDGEHHIEGIRSAFVDQLEGRPPRTEHGEDAVVRVFSVLLEEGPMRTSEIREAIYPEFEDHFSSEKSMWQSINRYFDDIPGIERVGHGKWDANPRAVDGGDV